MRKRSVTISAAWITGAFIVVAALVTGFIGFLKQSGPTTRVTTGDHGAGSLTIIGPLEDVTINQTQDGLKHLRNDLVQRSEIARELSVSFSEAAGRLGEILMSDAMTQTDMNVGASEAYSITDVALEHVVSEIKKYLDPKEIEAFDEVQAKWREYQKKDAEFAANQYEGGSIQPLIYASELNATATSRLVELEADLNYMRDTIVPYNERKQ